VSPQENDQDLDELLVMLKETRGFDFTGYKRSTLQRRIRRRMALLHLSGYAEYRDYLEFEPDEFNTLFDSMLINVTSFFRDPLAWQALQQKVLPELLAAKGARTPIRVERGLRHRRRGLHARDGADRGARARPVP
jgi:two-component system CheB/CheR fusion protein